MSKRQNNDRLDTVEKRIRNLDAIGAAVDRANDRMHVDLYQLVTDVVKMRADVERRIDHNEAQLDIILNILDELYDPEVPE